MKAPLTILVAYGSWHIGARVIHRLNSVPDIEIIGQAREADDALAQIVLRKPHLVILDVSLSQGTGFRVLQLLRGSDIKTAVMMTSTSTYSQYRKECMKAGADYFYYLPEDMEEMGAKVLELAMVRTPES